MSQSLQLLVSFLSAFTLRRILAFVLGLSLLSTIAPFSVSSAAHVCSMPCCAGGSCATGACDVSFDAPAEKPVDEDHCALDETHATHEAELLTKNVSENATDVLCGAENLTGISSLPLRIENLSSQSELSVKAQTFSQPCSPDCGATAGSFSQSRRTRELAMLGNQHWARPPTNALLAKDKIRPAAFNSQRRRQSPPRAPPSLA